MLDKSTKKNEDRMCKIASRNAGMKQDDIARVLKCGSRGGGQGVRPPHPPGKSQAIWVAIGNKQLDPPPPRPWKMLDPLWNLEK